MRVINTMPCFYNLPDCYLQFIVISPQQLREQGREQTECTDCPKNYPDSSLGSWNVTLEMTVRAWESCRPCAIKDVLKPTSIYTPVPFPLPPWLFSLCGSPGISSPIVNILVFLWRVGYFNTSPGVPVLWPGHFVENPSSPCHCGPFKGSQKEKRAMRMLNSHRYWDDTAAVVSLF